MIRIPGLDCCHFGILGHTELYGLDCSSPLTSATSLQLSWLWWLDVKQLSSAIQNQHLCTTLQKFTSRMRTLEQVKICSICHIVVMIKWLGSWPFKFGRWCVLTLPRVKSLWYLLGSFEWWRRPFQWCLFGILGRVNLKSSSKRSFKRVSPNH